MGIQRCKRKMLKRWWLTDYEQYKLKTSVEKTIQRTIKGLHRKECTIETCKDILFLELGKILPYVPPQLDIDIQLQPEIHSIKVEVSV